MYGKRSQALGPVLFFFWDTVPLQLSPSTLLHLLGAYLFCIYTTTVRWLAPTRVIYGDGEAVGVKCFHDCFCVYRRTFLQGHPGRCLSGRWRRSALALARDVSRLAALEARALVFGNLGLRTIRNVVTGLSAVEATRLAWSGG